MTRTDVLRMVKRRALEAGLHLPCESRWTTKLYDRTGDEITLVDVEKGRDMNNADRIAANLHLNPEFKITVRNTASSWLPGCSFLKNWGGWNRLRQARTSSSRSALVNRETRPRTIALPIREPDM
jgi:hypothetical protein